MSVSSGGRVPWFNRLRLVNLSNGDQGEWMAPDDIVEHVRQDFQSAIDWLHNSSLSTWSRRWAMSSFHLDGAFLKQYQRSLMLERATGRQRLVGVLRTDHQITVRAFSPAGDRCLAIDRQLQRRMATYDMQSRQRIQTQDLGDRAFVYEMVYDGRAQRWKINAFIQELPACWEQHMASAHLQLVAHLPTAVGRDS